MITIDKLAYRYANGRHHALNGFSATLESGFIYGLLGKNGEGKSTLLKLMAGLLQPQQGTITLDGQTPFSRSAALLADIFFLPEEFDLPKIEPDTYLKLTAPFYPRFSTEFFNKALDDFEIRHDQPISEYSLGQKKKFLLAFGLATNSRYLLLDEPTNGLDIPSKTKLRLLLQQAVKEERTCLISTHQARDLEGVINPIIMIHQGKNIFSHNYAAINRCLRVVRHDEAQALYREPTPEGVRCLIASGDEQLEKADLELLFNAVSSNGAAINQILNGGAGHAL